MITIEKEKILIKALKLRELANRGYGGERRNATNSLFSFCINNSINLFDLDDFEKLKEEGIRIVYLDYVFFSSDDLIKFLATKPFKEQLSAFFILFKQLLKQKITKNKK